MSDKEDNSWVKTDAGIATVGIKKESVSKVKEIIFIELPKKGPIKKGDKYVTLEAQKWSGHIESPVDGEIIEVNEELFDDPSKINKDPQGSWIMKVKL